MVLGKSSLSIIYSTSSRTVVVGKNRSDAGAVHFRSNTFRRRVSYLISRIKYVVFSPELVSSTPPMLDLLLEYYDRVVMLRIFV